MKDTDLFTKAATARMVGVDRSAVSNRLNRGEFLPSELIEIAGNTLITRRGIARWKRQRRRRAKVLITVKK
jgi:hypothetical protein